MTTSVTSFSASSLPPGSAVLVTGAAGFIGSHVCDHLVNNGHRIIAVDDLSTGRRSNLSHLEGRDDVTIHVADVCDAGALSAVIDPKKCL